jgi:hypothetical protein
LTLARELSRGADAAAARTSISRSYYAAFHQAQGTLAAIGVAIDREHRGHEQVQQILAAARHPAAQESARLLRLVQSARIRADYWLLDPFPERADAVRLALERASRIFERLADLASDPNSRERFT